MVEKEKILSKLNIKDYRNELEIILENKQFDEEAKSLILNIFYKLDIFYKDYMFVKKNCEPKTKFLEKYISIIKDECNIIQILSPKECIKNKKYIIDTQIGSIKTFPSEIILLYAIFELNQKYIEIKMKNEIYIENYEEIFDIKFIKFINRCMVTFINKGKIINSTEPIRDFNGWSWNVEIENLNNYIYNLVYQNLLILYGYDNISKISENNNVIDFLKENYLYTQNKFNSRFIKMFIKLCIEVYDNSSLINHNTCLSLKDDLINKINSFNNKKEYISIKSQDNTTLISDIEKIDIILNDINLIRKEYEQALNEDKNCYMCVSDFVDSLENRKNELLKEMNNNNKLLNPKEYLKNQDKFKNIVNLFENINDEHQKNAIFFDIIKLQKIFLENLKDKIIKTSIKKDLYNLAVQFRYYLNLPYKKDKNIFDNNKLITSYEEVEKILISKMIENKIIDTGFKSEEFNYKILKYIFKTKMIILDQLILKISFIDTHKVEISYYDGKMLEYKDVFEIPFIEEVSNKKDRKVKVFKIGG